MENQERTFIATYSWTGTIALRLLARTEEERRIAVAQVAHLKEVIDQKNDVIANLNGREGK